MSNNDELSDFANFYRTYKQLGMGNQPQASTTTSQNPAIPAQRPLSQRPPIQRPSRQAPLPNAPNIPAYIQWLNDGRRLFEELKQGHDGIFVALSGIQNV
jgi:hypothetical protein